MGWNDHVDTADIEEEIRLEVALQLGLNEPIPECNSPDRAFGWHSKDCPDCNFDAWVYDEALRRIANTRF